MAVALASCLVLAACTSSSKPPAYHPNPATKRVLAQHRPVADVDITLSGALSAHISEAELFGDCGASPPNHDYSVGLLINLDRVTYILWIGIYPFKGRAGTYSVAPRLSHPGDATDYAEVGFDPFQMLTALNDGAYGPGHVVLAPDLKSGTIDAPHTSTAGWWPGGKELSIEGAYSCLAKSS